VVLKIHNEFLFIEIQLIFAGASQKTTLVLAFIV